MTARRWQLPDDPLRTNVLWTSLLAVAATIGLSLLARTALPLGALYPLKASILFALLALVVMGSLKHHHPFARFGLANQVTTARAVIVVLVASLIGEEPLPVVAGAAAAASAVVTLLDGVDGWLARRSQIASRFGARFDMETDALLMVPLAVLAWRHGKAGGWVVFSGLLRYLFVAAGWAWSWLQRPLPASLRRKAVCVVQILGLTLVMVPLVTPPLSRLMAAVSLLALSYSFLVDIVWLWRHAPRT